MIDTILNILFGGVILTVVLPVVLLLFCLLMLYLHFIGSMIFNPIYHLFTGKNLKSYEEYRDMPREDDFF